MAADILRGARVSRRFHATTAYTAAIFAYCAYDMKVVAREIMVTRPQQ